MAGAQEADSFSLFRSKLLLGPLWAENSDLHIERAGGGRVRAPEKKLIFGSLFAGSGSGRGSWVAGWAAKRHF